MGFNTITDFDSAVITLLDPKGKRYAIASRMWKREAARKMLEAMKIDVQSRAVGCSALIKDIQTEEYEIVFTMELPRPMARRWPCAWSTPYESLEPANWSAIPR